MKVISTVGAGLACASCASAFVAPSSFSRVISTSPAASKALRMTEEVAAEPEEAPEPVPPAPAMSASIPFLTQPDNLEGMVGNVGFDPFGLATIFPAKFMRESEIKHGRIAMLAVVGWLVSEVVHLPGPAYMSENPVDAMAAVGPGPMLQIFLFCGFLEWKFHNGKMTMENMHEDGNEPGEFGFDPLKLSQKPADVREKYQLQEIKNGRLAMSAIGGLVHQSLLLGGGVPFHA
ncbi:unnamed protein product [Ectocarpus sp. 4 AP-2014]